MPTALIRLDVLHAIQLRGLVEVAELSRLLGTSEAKITELLEIEDAAGTVIHHGGRLPGWALTPEGRAEQERLLAAELDRSGARAMVEGCYLDFLEMNSELLAICSAWQTVTVDGCEVLNDHTDPVHDELVLARLDALHSRAMPLMGRLESSSPRFGGYAQRLTAAHERIISGDTEWLTRSTIDSYHSVWFELHENLLATLGKRRSQERQR